MAGLLRPLRTAARVAVAAGGVGSIGLMLRVGQRTPRFLLVLFFFWVIAPFVALIAADALSTRWSVMTRATLYGLMLAITAGSLAMYGRVAFGPARSQPAATFVMVPPVSVLLTAIALSIAQSASRRRGSMHDAR